MELTLEQALKKGVEAQKAGKAQEAYQYYASILKAKPKHPDANHNMGVLAVGVGKVEEALQLFKTALEVKPAANQFWFSYIDTLIKLDRMADAKAMLEQARNKGVKGDGFDTLEKKLGLKHKDDPAESKLQKLMALYNQKKLVQVFEEAQILTKQDANNLTLWNLMGATASQIGKLEDAVFAFQKAISINPKNSEAYNNMGNALKEQGKPDEAIDAYKKALSIKPDLFEAYINMGNILKNQEKFEEAIAAYKKALSINPKTPGAYNNMGNALKDQGKLDEAIESYNKALSIKPDYAEAYLNMGNALKDQGKLEEAIEAYNNALSIKPDYADAYNNMGVALKEQGKLDEAIEAYNKALSIKPDFAEAYNNMGNALKEQGKLEEAMEAYKKALSIKADYAEAYNNMGNALKEQGKLDEAIEAYNKALSIKPDYAEAYKNMGNALKEQGKLEEAIEIFEKLNDQNTVAQALECTYLLGNYNDFNLRLNSIAKKDPMNIQVAAISAFAANQRQNEDAYPFCKNPIDLIKFSHIKNHISEYDSFITDILNEMNKKKSVWEPENKATKGGFQTNSKLFSSLSPNMKILEDILKKELNLFRAEFNNSESIIFQRWPDEMKINAWYVRMLQNGHQDSHIHPGGWVSGVFYLKTVQKPLQNEGAIEFGLQGYDYPVIKENYPRRLYQPLDGDLVLFPSSLFHKTVPVIKNAERCVIAFDLVR